MAVITVNKALCQMLLLVSYYTPKLCPLVHRGNTVSESTAHVWTEMVDGAVVQRPNSRTGNNYLGHGPQTLAQLYPSPST